MKPNIFIVLLFCTFIYGCSGTSVIEGSYSMDGSHENDIDKESQIIVAVNSDFGFDGDKETSTNFLYSYIRAMKGNGFTNVFSYEDYIDERLEVDYFVLINLFKEVSDSEKIASNIMEANGLDPMTQGVSVAREYQTVQYYFSLNWMGKNKKDVFMTHVNALYESPCTDYASYKYLVYKAAENLNLNLEEEYEFQELITKSNNCAVFNSQDYAGLSGDRNGKCLF